MTTWDNHKNFAYGIISTAPVPALSGTGFSLMSGQGALFATSKFPVLMWPPNVRADFSNAEIGYCSTRVSDAFTITRAQQGTSAKEVGAGWQVAAAITPKAITDIQTAVNALETSVTSLTATVNALSTNTTPTITSFINAPHNHTNAAGGGQISASALTNVWWEEVGRVELGSPTKLIDIAITTKTFLQIIVFTQGDNPSAGTLDHILQFNNDTGNNYGFSWTPEDGAAYRTSANSSNIGLDLNPINNDISYMQIEVFNVANKPKQVMSRSHFTGITSSNWPIPLTVWGHWVNSTNQITSIQIRTTSDGNFAAGSRAVVLGHN